MSSEQGTTFRLIVRLPGSHFFVFHVSSTDSTRNFYRMLFSTLGGSLRLQENLLVTHQGLVLPNTEDALKDHNISHESTLYAVINITGGSCFAPLLKRKENLQELQTSCHSLKEQVGKLEADKRASEALSQTQSEKISDLQKEIADLHNLKEQLRKLESDKRALEDLSQKQLEQTTALEKESAAKLLEFQNQTAKSQAQAADAALGRLEAEKLEATQRMVVLEKELAASKADIQQLQASVQGLQNKLHAAEEEKSKAVASSQVLEKQLIGLEKKLTTRENELQKMKVDLDKANVDGNLAVQQLKMTCQTLQSQISKLEADKQAAAAETQSQIKHADALEKNVSEKESALNNAKAELRTVQKQGQESIVKLQQQLETKEMELSKILATMNAEKELLDALRNELTNKDFLLQQARADLDQLRQSAGHVDNGINDSSELREYIQMLESQNRSLKEEQGILRGGMVMASSGNANVMSKFPLNDEIVSEYINFTTQVFWPELVLNQAMVFGISTADTVGLAWLLAHACEAYVLAQLNRSRNAFLDALGTANVTGLAGLEALVTKCQQARVDSVVPTGPECGQAVLEEMWRACQWQTVQVFLHQDAVAAEVRNCAQRFTRVLAFVALSEPRLSADCSVVGSQAAYSKTHHRLLDGLLREGAACHVLLPPLLASGEVRATAAVLPVDA